MVMRDIRYMWSEIDSPLSGQHTAEFHLERIYLSMPNLLHPSRLVVFRRSSMWKNGTGDSESEAGAPPGIEDATFSTDHSSFTVETVGAPGAMYG